MRVKKECCNDGQFKLYYILGKSVLICLFPMNWCEKDDYRLVLVLYKFTVTGCKSV